jgi:hypothetical protein
MDDAEKDEIISRSAVAFTARRLARIEASIAEKGLRPESAADLWLARRAAAHALARLGLSNTASGA